jgi:glycosyltransferase involved in cell wall biosynthesis
MRTGSVEAAVADAPAAGAPNPTKSDSGQAFGVTLPAGRLRVMQVALSLAPGGTERLVIEIAKRLAPHVDMRVCCLDEPGAWAPELEAQGVPVRALARRAGFRPGLAFELAGIVRQHAVQVLHCHHYSPFVYGQLAALLKPGLRVVFTEHGRLSDAGPSAKRRIVNPWLGRLPSRIFAVSADLRRHMIAEGFPAERVEVAYNGIDAGEMPTAVERTDSRRELQVHDDEVVLGTVGRLDAVKDLGVMIHALASVRPAGAPYRLVLVGDGPERSPLEDLATGLGVRGVVTFTGYRADVRRLLPGFDLFLNSSVHEGVSLTILEAMAAGLPVVATAVGGTPEVVVHGETGMLVPSRSPEPFAGTLAELTRDRSRRIAMGRAGRARVLERFTSDAMIREYLTSYVRALN